MNKLVLIDGHSILNRAYYGVPLLTNSKGLYTNAVYGFLNIMFRILDEEKPDYLAVAFDVKAPTFRHNMYSMYKGTRKPMPQELHAQVPVIKDVLKAMNIKVFEMPGFEADDILGTLSVMASNDNIEVRIISGDRDLLQLATDKVMIRIPKTKKGTTEIENYYPEDVYNLYNVTPTQFIDVKALMGDTSDNIPGVKNIGEKTAVNIISTFGSIENAYEHADEIKPTRAGVLLKEDYDNAVLSKTLATINTNVPLEYSKEELLIKDMFNAEAYVLINNLEFKSMLKNFDKDANEAAKSLDIKDKTIVISSENELNNLTDIISKTDSEVIGCATYTHKEKIVDTQLTFDFLMDSTASNNNDIVFLALATKDNTYIIKIGTDISKEAALQLLKSITTNKKLSVFDIKTRLYDFTNVDEYIIDTDIINPNFVFDIALAAYLDNPLKNSYLPDDISRDYLNEVTDINFENSESKANKNNESFDEDKLINNLALEAYIAFLSFEILHNKLEDNNMLDLYTSIELPLAFILYDLEKRGVRVNRSALRRYGEELGAIIKETEQEIYAEIGEEFNINSPKQLGEILFVKLGIEGGKKTKTGYSTSADVLEKLAVSYPIIDKILKYRQLSKLKSTYADGLDVFIRDDERIHGTFNQMVTATGRISSTEPNLQNIPIRMEMGKKFREIFIPKDGYTFIDADYSQIELRILAHLSDDENLISAYNSDCDIHRITASKVFGTPLDEVTEEQRRNAKAVNFGIVYGISSFGLSQDINISKKEADNYIKQYFETYKGVKTYLDNLVALAKDKGYVTTLYNRIRPIPEISSSNFMQRAFGERIAMNSPIQGTAADIMKIAMINVFNTLKANNLDAHIVLQVHDELLIEVKDSDVALAKKLVIKSMQEAANLKVNLEIGINEGKNWLLAH